jgi:hypothetical protein
MFSGLNNGKYPPLTPFVKSNLFVEHCLAAGQLLHVQNYLSHPEGTGQWSGDFIPCCLSEADAGPSLEGNFCPGCTYLLGGLAVIPAWFCADSEICVGTNAHNKVKHILPVASLNKCFHDLAKEHKVPPMVIECMNCEFACHEGNPNLPFDAKECDIKIGLHMENKMGHTFCPGIMYY